MIKDVMSKTMKKQIIKNESVRRGHCKYGSSESCVRSTYDDEIFILNG